MRHFVTCLALCVAGLIVGNIAEAADKPLVNVDSFKRCISPLFVQGKDFDVKENPGGFTMNFDLPIVEDPNCAPVYHEYIRGAEHNRNLVARAAAHKLMAARELGLIPDLRESKTAKCKYCFSPPKEIHTQMPPAPCIKDVGKGIYKRESEDEVCAPGWHKAD